MATFAVAAPTTGSSRRSSPSRARARKGTIVAIDQNELMHTAVPANSERRFSRRRVFQAGGAGAGLVVAWPALGGRVSAADVTPTAEATTKAAAKSGPPTTIDSYLTINK